MTYVPNSRQQQFTEFLERYYKFEPDSLWVIQHEQISKIGEYRDYFFELKDRNMMPGVYERRFWTDSSWSWLYSFDFDIKTKVGNSFTKTIVLKLNDISFNINGTLKLPSIIDRVSHSNKHTQ